MMNKFNTVFFCDGSSHSGKDSLAFSMAMASNILFAEHSEEIQPMESMIEGQKNWTLNSTKEWLHTYHVVRLSMADKLKQEVSKMNSDSLEYYYDQDRKAEIIVDHTGEKVSRVDSLINTSEILKKKHGQNYFVSSIVEQAEWFLETGKIPVITDVRFDFEVELIKSKLKDYNIVHVHIISSDSIRNRMDDLIDRVKHTPDVVWYNDKKGFIDMTIRAKNMISAHVPVSLIEGNLPSSLKTTLIF